jgi:hypothetical protein
MELNETTDGANDQSVQKDGKGSIQNNTDGDRVISPPQSSYEDPSVLQGAAPDSDLPQIINGSSDRAVAAPDLSREFSEEVAIRNFFDQKTPMEIAKLLNEGCNLPLEYGLPLKIHGLRNSVLVDGVNDRAVQLAIKYLDRCESDEEKKAFLKAVFRKTVFNTDGRGNPCSTRWSAREDINGPFGRLMESPEVSEERWVYFDGQLSPCYFVRQTALALEDMHKIAQASLEPGAQYTNRHGTDRFGAALIQAEKTLLRYYELLNSVDNVNAEFVKEKDRFVRAMRERQRQFAKFWDSAEIDLGPSKKAVSIELKVALPEWVRGQLDDEFKNKKDSIFVGTQNRIDEEVKSRKTRLREALTNLIDNKYGGDDEARETLKAIRAKLTRDDAFKKELAPFFVQFDKKFIDNNKGWLENSPEFKLKVFSDSGESEGFGAVALDFDSARNLHEKFARLQNVPSANLWLGREHQTDLTAKLVEPLVALTKEVKALKGERDEILRSIEEQKGSFITHFEGGELRQAEADGRFNITWWSADGKTAWLCGHKTEKPKAEELVKDAEVLAAINEGKQRPPNLENVLAAQDELITIETQLRQKDDEIAEKSAPLRWYEEFNELSLGKSGFTPALDKLIQVDREFRLNGIRDYVDVNASGIPHENVDHLPQEQRPFASEAVFRWYGDRIALGLEQNPKEYEYNPAIPRENQLSPRQADAARAEARLARRKALTGADKIAAEYLEGNPNVKAPVAVAWLQDKAGNRVNLSGSTSISNKAVEQKNFLDAYNLLQDIAIKEGRLNKLLDTGAGSKQEPNWGMVREAEKDVATAQAAARKALKKIWPELSDSVPLHSKMLTCHGKKDVSIVIANATARNEDIQSAAGALDALARYAGAIVAQKKVLGHLSQDRPALERMGTLDGGANSIVPLSLNNRGAKESEAGASPEAVGAV